MGVLARQIDRAGASPETGAATAITYQVAETETAPQEDSPGDGESRQKNLNITQEKRTGRQNERRSARERK